MPPKKAFTLIELLVVIAVITLLSSIVLVALQGGREKANTAKTLEWARSVEGQLGGDMVASWNFNEGTGTTAYDATGYNNGTLVGGVSWTDGVQGLTGKALQFDGSSGYVDVGSGASLNLIDSNGFTIETWFKSTANSKGFIAKQTIGAGMQSADWQFGLKIWDSGGTNGHVAFMTYNGGTTYGSIDYLESTTALNDNQWHHAAVVGNSINRYLYIDGILNNGESKGYNIYYHSNTNVLLGYATSASQKYFNGIIDEVRIYNRALTAMEIQKHYAQTLPRHSIAKR